MRSENTEVEAQPQADGDPRRFQIHGDPDKPTLVHTEKSGPAFRIEQRNAALTSLVEPLARLLYRAMQMHALGVIDDVLFDDLPVRTKDELITAARTALNLQSSVYREYATRMAKETFTDAMTDAGRHYDLMDVNADAPERERRKQAMAHVATYVDILDIPALMLGVYARVLTEPLPLSANAQVVRTAGRAWS